MVFANPVPQDFGGAFYEETGSRFYLSDEKLKGDYAPVRYARELQIFHRFCKTGRVLDVGCSTGGFLYQLNQTFPANYQTWGTDVAREAAAFAKTKGIQMIEEDFLEWKSEAPKFDAVTFWAVLEHVLEPSRFLNAAFEILQPNGICVVLVPNFESLATKVLGAKYRYILPQHLNYFTRKSLTRLGRAAGFDVVYSSTTHFNPIVIWQDLRSKGEEVSDAQRAKLLTRTNTMKASKSFAPARFLYNITEKTLNALGLADNLVIVLKAK